MRLIDRFREIFGETELVLTEADKLIHTEEKEIEAVITDAINALASAISNVLAEHSSDKAALAQAQSDRDAAQASLATANQQLADAETQINALTAQINPPAPPAA